MFSGYSSSFSRPLFSSSPFQRPPVAYVSTPTNQHQGYVSAPSNQSRGYISAPVNQQHGSIGGLSRFSEKLNNRGESKLAGKYMSRWKR
jgi:hypothetical protein